MLDGQVSGRGCWEQGEHRSKSCRYRTTNGDVNTADLISSKVVAYRVVSDKGRSCCGYCTIPQSTDTVSFDLYTK